MTKPIRLVVVVSHPIQYFAPLYRALARDPDIDLTVLFASRIGLRRLLDPEMGVELAWASDLTAGYRHAFLPGADRIEVVSFFGVNNPGVGPALAAHRPDVVLIHGYAMVTMLSAVVWCRLQRVPALMMSDSSGDRAPSGLGYRLKRLLLPLLLRQFAAILTMGERSDAHLAALGYPAQRLHRTPAMIDEGFWRARAARPDHRQALRRTLAIADDAVVALVVGKLSARKRVADVIEALARPAASAHRSAPVLVIAGDGQERASLEALAAARGLDARFLGFVNIDALPAVYAAADLLVHAADFEPYGMVLLEAAVLGLPLVVSDRVGGVGPASIARPGVNAVIVPCGDIDALAAAIGRLAAEPDLRAAMASASDKLAQTHAGGESLRAVKRAAAQALNER